MNQQPVFLAACRTLTPGGECPSPDAPVVIAAKTHAGETSVTAMVPTGFTATSVRWMVERRNGLSWDNLWTHKSVQDAPLAGGTTVEFGVPGLAVGTEHSIRVSFCNDHHPPTPTDDECYCWSPTTTFTTTAFQSLGPAPPPSPIQQKVEDLFDRRDTDPKCCIDANQDQSCDNGVQLGDGLGPLLAWVDCMPGEGTHVRIENADGWTTPTAQMYYTAQTASHPHSYSELQFRVDDFGGGFKYNLQVGTRIVQKSVEGGSVLRGYYLKLLKDARGCSVPTMILVRLPDEYNEAKCDGGSLLPSSAFMTIPTPDPTDKCDEAPPLETEDTGRPGYSKPVWMRVEARDFDGVPRYTGAIAWGTCPVGQPMSACDHYCVFPQERVDTGDLGGMSGLTGQWGASFHEKNYALEVFRAGSEPTP